MPGKKANARQRQVMQMLSRNANNRIPRPNNESRQVRSQCIPRHLLMPTEKRDEGIRHKKKTLDGLAIKSRRQVSKHLPSHSSS